MVVEFLTFDLAGLDSQQWLLIEDQVWGAELRSRPGFVHKQIWGSEPGVVHAVIWWKDLESWNAIGPNEVAAIDERMGEWLRRPTMAQFQVISDNGFNAMDSLR